jgi:hypothetical protein
MTSQPPHPPGLDPEQFVGGTPAGEDDPHAFTSNDQSDTTHEGDDDTGEARSQDAQPEEES